MENKDDMQFELLFLEIAVVIVICIVILCRIGKNNNGRNNTIVNPEQVTATPTDVPTVTSTPSLSPTSTPVPTQTPTPIPSVEKKVTSNHKFKPYTRYTAYNIPGSQQYKLQQIALTSADTGIRMVEDPFGEWRYCVALGTYWAGGHPEHIGRCVDVFMQNGAILKCVLADVKRTEDTVNKENRYGANNKDVLEFIVDDKKISADVKRTGNMSNAGEEFIGDAMYMIIYDLWIDGFGKE